MKLKQCTIGWNFFMELARQIVETYRDALHWLTLRSLTTIICQNTRVRWICSKLDPLSKIREKNGVAVTRQRDRRRGQWKRSIRRYPAIDLFASLRQVLHQSPTENVDRGQIGQKNVREASQLLARIFRRADRSVNESRGSLKFREIASKFLRLLRTIERSLWPALSQVSRDSFWHHGRRRCEQACTNKRYSLLSQTDRGLARDGN